MYTQCPECNTVFRITPEQLAAAGGRVRCGECHSVFNAQLHLIEQVPRHPERSPAPEPTPPVSTTPKPSPNAVPAPAAEVPADEFDALFATEADAEPTESEALDEAIVMAEESAPGGDIDLDEFFSAPPAEETTTASEPAAATEADAAAELDALLAAEAESEAGPEPTESEALDEAIVMAEESAPGGDIDLDEFFSTPPAEKTTTASEPAAATEADAAADLDALLAAEIESEAEAEPTESEALDEAIATAEDSDTTYDVDLNEFFSTPPDEEESIATAPAESEAAALEHVAFELNEFLPPAEETAPRQPAERTAPADELFGEAHIESLLNSQDAGNLELPWERADEEQPAVVIDLSEGEETPPDEFADLNLDSTGNEIDDFDLPEAQLTSARPLAAEGPTLAAPLPELLADSTAPGRSLASVLGWFVGIVLLLTALVAQYGYLNRDALVLRYPQLRPALELACGYTGCTLPLRRDLAAITLLERDVHSHASYQGALVITATLVNRAGFAQPYPDVEVIMRDLGGNVVAARRFQPAQYLSGDHPAEFASQATAQLLLEVTDPGAAAVGFEFNFY